MRVLLADDNVLFPKGAQHMLLLFGRFATKISNNSDCRHKYRRQFVEALLQPFFVCKNAMYDLQKCILLIEK